MKANIKRVSTLIVVVAAILTTSAFTPKKEKSKMKVQEKQVAPTFLIKDVNGASVDLKNYKGKKVMITFFRNVGCPVCNLRFNELEKQADYFKQKGMVLLAIYESSAENMKKYLENDVPYALMIPNPDQSLYNQYELDRSGGKMVKGMFNGAIKKMKAGKKLFKNKIKQDGNNNRIEAEFLIDENGVITKAHYGRFLGDYISIDDIKKFLNY